MTINELTASLSQRESEISQMNEQFEVYNKYIRNIKE